MPRSDRRRKLYVDVRCGSLRIRGDSTEALEDAQFPAFNSVYLPPGYPPPGLDRPHVDNGVDNG